MNTSVNTNVDFGTNSSNTNTTSSIGSTPNNSSPTYTNTYNSNGNVQTESMDLSFATEQVATESKSILDSIGDFFSDVGEGLKNTGAAIVDGAKTVANWAITGIKDLGSSISEACSNLASNVSSILGSALSWAKDTYISLQATSAVIGTTVVSGIADIGEGIVDGLTWCGGKLVEGGSWLVGKVAGWFSDDAEEAVMEWREQAKTDVKEFIATDWVGEANDWFYQETALGRYINENSYLKYDSEAMQKLRGASEMVGKLVLATAATVVTGGAASPIALGFLFGTGEQAEKLYQENPNTTGAQELGIFVSGLGEAANWYAQGKMGSSGLDFLNVLKSNGLKNTGSAFLSAFKSTLGNIKSNGFKNTITGMVKNSNWASLYAADNLADSLGIIGDNVGDWLVGNEEFNLKTAALAGGELLAAWGLNMFFDGASEYLGKLGKGADDVGDAIKQADNIELSQTELDGITAGKTYFQPAGDLPNSTIQTSFITMMDASNNDVLSAEFVKFLDDYSKNPEITLPNGIPESVVDYLNAYMKDPYTTLPPGMPQQITAYLDSKTTSSTISFADGGSSSASPSLESTIPPTNNYFQQAGDLTTTAPLFTTAPLSTAAIQTNLPDNVTKFLDDFVKDPNTTIPQGMPQEIVDYLNNYLQDPLVTPPTGMPQDIINYMNSKSITTGVGNSSGLYDSTYAYSTPSSTSKIKTPSQEKIELNQKINAEIMSLNKWDPDYANKLADLQKKANLEMQLLEAIHNKGMTLEDYLKTCGSTSQLDEATAALVKQQAEAVQARAIQAEPQVTALMESLQDGNSRLTGLEYRFKSTSSIENKMGRLLEQGYSLNGAAQDINDSLRYTFLIDESAYDGSVLSKLSTFTDNGYQIKYYNNAWGSGKTYQGLNVTLEDPTGMMIEVQFHTDASFNAKQTINHTYYEISRSPLADQSIKNLSNEIQSLNQSLYVRNTGFSHNQYSVMSAIADYKGIDFTPVGAGESAFTLAQGYNPNAKSYQTYVDFSLDTEAKRLAWEKSLKTQYYVDPITGRNYTYEQLIHGYIGESDQIAGSYAVLNTVNRAMDVDSGTTLYNLLKKDVRGNVILDADGLATMEIRHCFGNINEYKYNPHTDEIFAINWQGNKYGLNADRSVGTFNDLLVRVKSESQAISDALGMYTLDSDLVVGRGASWDSLERFGVRKGDTAETIFAKLTRNGNTYCDSGFMSSTPELGGGFMNGNEINYIMNVNQGTSIGNFAGYNAGEKEVLLDYGTKFKIDSVKKDEYGKVYIFLSQK